MPDLFVLATQVDVEGDAAMADAVKANPKIRVTPSGLYEYKVRRKQPCHPKNLPNWASWTASSVYSAKYL